MSVDDRLKALFAELRVRDERETPDLSGLLARPRSAPRRSPRALLVPAAGLAAGAAVLVFVLRSERPAPEPISQWRSPTAFLLQTPDTGLLAGAPRVGESWLPLPAEVKR